MYTKDSNGSAQSDQSLCFPPGETLDHWLPIECPWESLIKWCRGAADDDCAEAQADLSLECGPMLTCTLCRILAYIKYFDSFAGTW